MNTDAPAVAGAVTAAPEVPQVALTLTALCAVSEVGAGLISRAEDIAEPVGTRAVVSFVAAFTVRPVMQIDATAFAISVCTIVAGHCARIHARARISTERAVPTRITLAGNRRERKRVATRSLHDVCI